MQAALDDDSMFVASSSSTVVCYLALFPSEPMGLELRHFAALDGMSCLRIFMGNIDREIDR